ncbi:hypothetical protein IAR55_006360 [Kwoniella newhampshirensis]|uniref:FAD dependent oxidoreductase domain-containing protein n=1 Tax=Kwoniella newhampshirensis TaxID=1651941 RepID=A0AAW0YGB0_9TREE
MSTFPQPFKSSVSHWQATNRGTQSLYGYNKDGKPPAQADIVIVGGGTMGASLSYFLTRDGAEGAGRKVVLLEAKDIGSGASGRNGGHVAPAHYLRFKSYQRPMPAGTGASEEEVVKIIQAERTNLEIVEDIVRKEGIAEEIEWWRGELMNTHTAGQLEDNLALYNDWLAARKKYLGVDDDAGVRFVKNKLEAAKLSRMKDVVSVDFAPTGSVHSHKLCTALMRLAIQSSFSDFELVTWCPVNSVVPKREKWIVKTAKGDILTRKVILCTNAHTHNFFPKGDPVGDFIAPCFVQCSHITPPPPFSGTGAFKNTVRSHHGWYWMQTKGGGIVIGGGDDDLVDNRTHEEGFNLFIEDDSKPMEAWTKLQSKYMPNNFPRWGEEAEGEGLDRAWGGILTRTKDTLPLIGEVPGKKGMLIAAGFHGHGQSRIFSVAKALSKQLATGRYDTELLPQSFELTMERLQRCRTVRFPGHEQEGLVQEYVNVEQSVWEEKASARVEVRAERQRWCVIM